MAIMFRGGGTHNAKFFSTAPAAAVKEVRALDCSRAGKKDPDTFAGGRDPGRRRRGLFRSNIEFLSIFFSLVDKRLKPP
jgi:hypothetical protein